MMHFMIKLDSLYVRIILQVAGRREDDFINIKGQVLPVQSLDMYLRTSDMHAHLLAEIVFPRKYQSPVWGVLQGLKGLFKIRQVILEIECCRIEWIAERNIPTHYNIRLLSVSFPFL